ncbi:MAG: TetR/AcrR family transcriptional regulator [Ruminococcaceae bacterium]|nr:TetR/AcrR family transcriptional regulator [Oscillospiraceae bacterium]
MPPKVKITKQDIIDTALALIREGGAQALNARGIAAALNCSTQPIFSNFSTMDALQDAVTAAAYACYLAFLQREVECGNYPQYKAMGMAYIRFAKEEKELFRLLFMCDRGGQDLVPTADFSTSVEIIMQANGISREKAELMHLEMWTCVHGIAAMLATSFFAPEWELISRMLTDIYQGLRAKHTSKEGEQ